MSLRDWLDRTLYPDVRDNWDDQLFRERILTHLRPDTDLLDLGAGAGIVPQMDFRGHAGRICGVDPDERVVDNPYLDEGKVGFGEAIPYPDGSFDVVVADNVLEHLDEPDRVFREVHRVLRPDGIFLAKTPNRMHYVPVIATLTPHSFHEWINRRRGRDEDDTFPTRYRANTPAAVRRLGRATGFSEVDVDLVESRPEYLRMTPATYLVGWAYEKAVNTVPPLRAFRVLLVATLTK